MIELKTNLDLKQLVIFDVNYSVDNSVRHTDIKTSNGIRVNITSSNNPKRGYEKFMIIKILNKRLPFQLQKWVDKNGWKKKFTFDSNEELQYRYYQFIHWLKTIRTNNEREQAYINDLKNQIKANSTVALIVMLEMYKRQTNQERREKTSKVKNWQGFTKYDSKYLSTLSERIIKKNNKHLSANDKKAICNKMPKYAAQYLSMRGIISSRAPKGS